MEKEIKLSFFRRVKMSILDFDKYHIIASEGLGRAMMYLVKLMLVFTLLLVIAFSIKILQIANKATNYLKETTPNFYFQDNKFYIESEDDVVLENHEYIDIKVILSNLENYNEEEITNFDGITIVLLKNKALLKNQNSTSIISQNYEEIQKVYNISELNKDMVVNYLNGENGYKIIINIVAMIFISILLIYFLTAILDTIALSLLGYIVSKMIRVPLKYSAIYSISISAITLPIILNLIYIILNLFTGFVIPYFQIMYTLVSYICLIAALLIMKSEITKKKVQIKIEIMNKEKIEEQKREEENKEKEEKDREKEDKKENKKEDLKDKVNDKINKKKDKPEPQANIKEQ